MKLSSTKRALNSNCLAGRFRTFLEPRLGLIVLLAICTPCRLTRCSAQSAVYTSRSEFNLAISASQTLTFEEVAASSPFSIGVPSVTISNVTFSNAGSRLFVASATGGLYPIAGTGQYLWNFDSSTPVGISPLPGATAFGADFSGGISPHTSFNATLTINLAGGPSYAYSFSGPLGSWVFFGVTFDQPIVSILYDDGGVTLPGSHEEMLDNVTFATTVPEPSSCLLMVLGLIILRYVPRHAQRLL